LESFAKQISVMEKGRGTGPILRARAAVRLISEGSGENMRRSLLSGRSSPRVGERAPLEADRSFMPRFGPLRKRVEEPSGKRRRRAASDEWLPLNPCLVAGCWSNPTLGAALRTGAYFGDCARPDPGPIIAFQVPARGRLADRDLRSHARGHSKEVGLPGACSADGALC